jgi:hypothetical protein
MAPWADRAVVVVHGIGVQQRGTTRDGLMKALVGAGATDEGYRDPDPPDPVAPGSPLPQRPRTARRDSTAGGVERSREVDVYEVYWAPLLSGQTSPRTVLWWLLGATFLPGPAIKRASRKTVRDLAALAFWLGLVAFATLLTVSSVGNVIAQAVCEPDPTASARSAVLPSWCEPPLRELAVDADTSAPQRAFLRLRASVEVLVGSLDFEDVADRPLAQYSTERVAALLDNVRLLEWLALLAVVFLTAQTLHRSVELARGGSRRGQGMILGAEVTALLLLLPLVDPVLVALGWVLALAGVAARYARHFLAESLGDVQVYVDKDENSRHFASREAVIGAAEQVLATVAARRYREVVMLGHSLGAVVAYDALGRLAERDRALTEPLRALVTFGAAIEKVRYFFDRKGRGNDERDRAVARSVDAVAGREDLAWLNLWYPSDLVANPVTTFRHRLPTRSVAWHPGLSVPDVLAHSRGHLVVNLRFRSPLRPPGAIAWSHNTYLRDPRVAAVLADVVFADFADLTVPVEQPAVAAPSPTRLS